MTVPHVLSRRSKTLTHKRGHDASDICQGDGAALCETGYAVLLRSGLRLDSVPVRCKDGSRLLEIENG
jgi:hypothetical protein